MKLSQLQALTHFSEAERQEFSHYLIPHSFETDVLLLNEGDCQGSMYFLLEGKIDLKRGTLALGQLEAGHHLGELSLISGKPRSASAITASSVEIAELSPQKYQQLQSEAPQLAVKLLNALLSQVGSQLTYMTDRFGQLLEERSLPRTLQLKIDSPTGRHSIPTGTAASALLPEQCDGSPVVAALVNNKIVALHSPLFADGHLAALSLNHWEGERIQRHSASLLVLEALHQISPQTEAQVSLSVGGTQWLSYANGPEPDKDELEQRIQQLVHEAVRFRHEQWSVDEARAFCESNQRQAMATLLETRPQGQISLASCGEYYVLSKGPLLPDSSYLKELKIQTRPGGLVLQTAGNSPSPDAFSAYADMLESNEPWLQSLGIYHLGELNHACLDGRITRLIAVAEGVHEKRLGQIADHIFAQRDSLKIICVAGPSSSGKTTFIQRLSTQLRVNGIQPLTLSLDDYYMEHKFMPLDENGQADFEALEALNLELLQSHLSDLVAGKKVQTARFDFKEGRSYPNGGTELQLHTNQILLIEGIHGLNPRLLANSAAPEQLFRIFIQPLLSLAIDEQSRINPSDLRLLRRIVRDRYGRSTSAAETIRRWPSVRRGEHQHIFPHVKSADLIFDTSLLYELSAIKIYAERYLLEVSPEDRSYMTAFRLYQLLQNVIGITPELVPQHSIVREFIGSGAYRQKD